MFRYCPRGTGREFIVVRAETRTRKSEEWK